MEFIIKFLLLILITILLLYFSTPKWVKYNILLMLSYLLIAGMIFIF